jgi:hypothetical protein
MRRVPLSLSQLFSSIFCTLQTQSRPSSPDVRVIALLITALHSTHCNLPLLLCHKFNACCAFVVMFQYLQTRTHLCLPPLPPLLFIHASWRCAVWCAESRRTRRPQGIFYAVDHSCAHVTLHDIHRHHQPINRKGLPPVRLRVMMAVSQSLCSWCGVVNMPRVSLATIHSCIFRVKDCLVCVK